MPAVRRLRRRAAMAALLSLASPGGGPVAVREPALPSPAAALRAVGTLRVDTARLGADGLSGLHVGPDLTVTAVGDRGQWCRARLSLAPDGSPLGLHEPRAGRLRGPWGMTLGGGMLADAESLAALPDGSWLVGFERLHRIHRYRALDGLAEAVALPPGLAAMAANNGGLESVGVLADGRWLILMESPLRGGERAVRQGWIGGPAGWSPLTYRPTAWHEPSDLCPLPDGGALVLERHFDLPWNFSARIVRLPPVPARPDLLEGVEVARLAPPQPTDNWEGISAFRHGGRDLVAVLSDSNGLPMQRTLLTVMAWTDQAAT